MSGFASPLSTAAAASGAIPSSAAQPHPHADPAAAAFLENETAAADEHFFDDDDEDGDSDGADEDGDDDGDEEGADEAMAEQQAGGLSSSAALVSRDYRLHIEFDRDFAARETSADGDALFQSLRDAWAKVQKSLLPMANEWIDTLTRIDFPEQTTTASPATTAAAAAASSSAAAAASSSSLLGTPAFLRSQRDRFLLRAVGAREQVDSLLAKCRRLQLHVSTLEADRIDHVRRVAERGIVDEGMNAEPGGHTSGGGGSGAPARVPPSGRSASASVALLPAASLPSGLVSSGESAAAHTRYAVRLLQHRAKAERRATKKIRAVKRKHAKLVEQERLQRQTDPAAAAAYAANQALRRPFSQERIPPTAPSHAAAAHSTSKQEHEEL